MPEQFIRLSVTSKQTKDPIQYFRNIQAKFQFELQGRLLELAEQTAEKMRDVIRTSKKRPSLGNNLENSIDITILNPVHGLELGIGSINKLKAQAPYFEVLDAGGYVPYSTAKGAPLGSFVPGADRPVSGGKGQNWERSGNKGYFMKPEKAIEGIDYSGIANRILINKLETEIQPWILKELSK